jgi:hypothetical protein
LNIVGVGKLFFSSDPTGAVQPKAITQVLPQQQQWLRLVKHPLQQPLRAATAKERTAAFRC